MDEQQYISSIGEYVGEVPNAKVTVRWLERETDLEYHFVHVRCEVEPDDTGQLPDSWEINWYHTAGLIRDELKPFLDRWCPLPEEVWEAAQNVMLPEELRGMFGPWVPKEKHNLFTPDADS